MTHRGPIHSLFAGACFGIAFAVAFNYGGLEWWLGFACGFFGTALHLLGDILAYMAIKPLWPFLKREVSLGLFRSSNPAANKGFATLGALAFLAVLLKHVGYL